jgi:hypothetical protein
MSRASSRHIQRLEEVVTNALEELGKVNLCIGLYTEKAQGNPNCQCGVCRAQRILRSVPPRASRSA